MDAEAEVDEFDFGEIGCDEDVLEFYVAVDYVVLVEVGEGEQELFYVGAALGLGEFVGEGVLEQG